MFKTALTLKVCVQSCICCFRLYALTLVRLSPRLLWLSRNSVRAGAGLPIFFFEVILRAGRDARSKHIKEWAHQLAFALNPSSVLT